MQRLRWLVAAGLILVGFVWIGQGTGLIPGSFMTSDPFWAVVGAAVAVVGLALGLTARRAAG